MMIFGLNPVTTRVVWIALVTGLFYAPSLALGLISDDFSLIELARSSSVASLFVSKVAGDYYRPVVQLSFLLDYEFWSAEPFGYHATNLFLHLLNTILVSLIAKRILKDGTKGWAVCGLYFGLTPTHASSVLWICGRTDLLCATFYLLSVWCFLGALKNNRRALVCSVLTAFIALLCKEMAFSIPLVCFVISFATRTRDGSRSRFRGAVKDTMPLILITFAHLGLRYSLFGSLPQSSGHGIATVGMLFANLPRYAVGLVFPVDLETIKPFLRAHREVLFLVSAITAVFCLVVGRKLARDRIIFSIIICTCICLLPVLRVYAPWYLYIPSVGVALMIGRLAVLVPRIQMRKVWVRAFVLVIVIVHLTSLAQAQIRAYTSGSLTDGAIQSLRSLVPKKGRAVVLAIPSEYRGVPVFGWIGNLSYAMKLVGHPIDVHAIVGMRISDPEIEPEVIVDGASDHIHLAILGDRDFFRLQDLGVLTGATHPEVGQVFSTAHESVEVMALNASRQPSRLKIIPRSFAVSDPDIKVFAFKGGELNEI
jgi:hypothetical protein